MISKILLASLFLTGCGSNFIDDHIRKSDPSPRRPAPVIDDAFKQYVARFEDAYGQKVSMLIQFEKQEAPRLGVCYSWDDGHREIKIDREGWDDMSDLGKEQLMFHELGHCQLNRPHIEDNIKLGRWLNAPKSIMHPYVFGEWSVYEENHDYYVKELLNK